MRQHGYSPHGRKAWVSHFLQCQYDSYKHFLNTGLKESFRMFRTVLSQDKFETQITFEFLPEFYKIKPPRMTLTQCLILRRSWLGLIFIPLKIRFQVRHASFLKPRVAIIWLGLVQCPLMTRHGHFIVRGVPRVILSQMVRRAGVYFRCKWERKGIPKSYVVDIIASRGTWLRLEMKPVRRRQNRASVPPSRLRSLYVLMPGQPAFPFFAFLRCLGMRPGTLQPWVRGLCRDESKTHVRFPGHSLMSSVRQATLFSVNMRYEVRVEDRDKPPRYNEEQQRRLDRRYVRFGDVKKIKRKLWDIFQPWFSYEGWFEEEEKNKEFSQHPFWTHRHRKWSLIRTEATHQNRPKKDLTYYQRGLNVGQGSWIQDELMDVLWKNWIGKVEGKVHLPRFQRQNQPLQYPPVVLGSFPSAYERLFPEAFLTEGYISTYEKLLCRELFSPMFYDLGTDGRKHINEVLGLKTPHHVGSLTCQDVLFSAYYLLEAARGNHAAETNMDHLQHKILKPVGQQLQQVMFLGLIELKRNVMSWFKFYDASKLYDGAVKPPTPHKNLRFPQRRKIKYLKHLFHMSNVPLPRFRRMENLRRSKATYMLGLKSGKKRVPNRKQSLSGHRPPFNKALKRLEKSMLGFKARTRNNAKSFPNVASDRRLGPKKVSQRTNIRGQRRLRPILSPWQQGSLYGLQRELKAVFHTVPFNKALRRFFGTNPLSQFLDETNAIAELTHKRRLSFMGLGGLDRYNATMDVRSIHPSHYGRICPIETPEGQNAGLVHSLTTFAQVNESVLTSTFFPVYKTWIETRKVVKKRLDVHGPIVPGDKLAGRFGFYGSETLHYRQFETPDSGACEDATWACVSQRQVLSLATSCIPFMEHNDGNRALMGSNMQRQAVALLMPISPIITSGMESKIHMQSHSSKTARVGGIVCYVDAKRVLLAVHASSIPTQSIKYVQQRGLQKAAGKKGFLHTFPPANAGKKGSLDPFPPANAGLDLGRETKRKLGFLHPCHKETDGLIRWRANTGLLGLAAYGLQNQYKVSSPHINPTLSAGRLGFRLKAKGVNLHGGTKWQLMYAYFGPNGPLWKPQVQTSEFRFTSRNVCERLLGTLFAASFYNARMKRGARFQNHAFMLPSKLPSGTGQRERRLKKHTYQNSIYRRTSQHVLSSAWTSSMAEQRFKATVQHVYSRLFEAMLMPKLPFAFPRQIQTEFRRRAHLETKLASFQHPVGDKESPGRFLGSRDAYDGKQGSLDPFSPANDGKKGRRPFSRPLPANAGKDRLKTPTVFLTGKKGSKDPFPPANAGLALPRPNPKPTRFCHGNLTKDEKRFEKIACTGFMGCNQHTYRLQRPCVTFGLGVGQGQFVATNASCARGALSLGQNLMVGYTPWQGYNFEDAILINQRLVDDDLLTSLHIETYYVSAKHLGSQRCVATTLGLKSRDLHPKSRTMQSRAYAFTSRPNFRNKENLYSSPSNRFAQEYLTRPAPKSVHCSNGVLRPGSWATQDMAFLFKWQYASVKKAFKTWLRRMYRLPPKHNCSLTVPWQIYGRVIDVRLERKRPLNANFHLAWQGRKGLHTCRFQNKLRICRRRKTLQWPFYLSKFASMSKGVKVETSSIPFAFKVHLPRLKKRQLNVCRARLKNPWTSKPKRLVNFISRLILTKGDFSSHKARKKFKAKNHLSRKRRSKNKMFWFPKPKLQRTRLRPYTRALYGKEALAFSLATPRRIQVGDKLSGRHGNKGIVSRILQRSSMPFCPDGTPLDLALNPLGVPSRMNVGQLFECLLGFAGSILKQNFNVPSFDETYGAQMSRTLSYTKLYEARLKTGVDWYFNPNFPGKVRCFDGRTGEAFLNPITVGKPYILKLIHCVEEKLHARNTGPYNIVTQQPLRGRRRKGGQRVGEMEVWALEGFGAAYVLHELLNVKSDSMVGRATVEDHILNAQPLTWDNPESFKLLAHEILALGFNVGLFHRNKHHKTKVQNRTYLF